MDSVHFYKFVFLWIDDKILPVNWKGNIHAINSWLLGVNVLVDYTDWVEVIMSLNKSYRATLDSFWKNGLECAYILWPIFLIMCLNNEFIIPWHYIVYNLDKVWGVHRPPSRATHVQAWYRETKPKLSDVVLLVLLYRVITSFSARSWISVWDLIIFTIYDHFGEVFKSNKHSIIAVPLTLRPSVIFISIEVVVLPLLVGHRSLNWCGDVVWGWLPATAYLSWLRLFVVSVLRICKNTHRVIDVWLRQRPIVWAYWRVSKAVFHTVLPFLPLTFHNLSVWIRVHFVIYFWLCHSVPHRSFSVCSLTIEGHC